MDRDNDYDFDNVAAPNNINSDRKIASGNRGSRRSMSEYNNQTIDNADDEQESQQIPDSAAAGDQTLNLKPSNFQSQPARSNSLYQSNASPDKLDLYKSIQSEPRTAVRDAGDQDDNEGTGAVQRLELMEDNTDFEGNMKHFIHNFGVSINIPSYYPRGGAIFPQNPTMVLQQLQYVIPKSTNDKNEIKYRTTQEDGSLSEPSSFIGPDGFSEDLNTSSCIQLIEMEGNVPKIRQEVLLPNSKNNLIKFSPNGEYLVIFKQQISQLDIYYLESPDAIFEVMEQIRNNDQPLVTFTNKKQLSKINKLRFDQHSKYLALYGNQYLSIINLNTHDKIPMVELTDFKIDTSLYKQILDLQIVSHGDDEGGFNCEIACMDVNSSRVEVFDIYENNNNQEKIIVFESESLQSLIVRISGDLKEVIFLSKSENYLLQLEIRNGQEHYNQNRIADWLEGMNILKVYNHPYIYTDDEGEEMTKEGFVILFVEDYSNCIHGRHIHDGLKTFKIERNIEPNTVNVLDFIIIEDQVWISMLQDQKFQVDNFTYEDSELGNTDMTAVKNWEIDITEGFSSNWPYLSYRGLTNFSEGGYQAGAQNFQVLYNATKRNELIRIRMPDDCYSQPFSYLTDKTNELYIIVEFDERYEMHQVYLEDYKDSTTKQDRIYNLEKRLTFDREEYGNLEAFHVRGGDLKHHDDTEANNKSISFFIINSLMYYWMQGMDDGCLMPVNLSNGDQIEVTQSQFDVIDDANIVVSQRCKHSNGINVFKVYQIQIQFSTFDIMNIYEEKEQLLEVINYGYDERDSVIILLKKEKSKKDKYHVTLIDILDDFQIKVLYNDMIKQKDIIGRLKSGLYMIVNGHIYFNNNLTKIRYDLLKSNNTTKEYRYTQIFDVYRDVLKLDKQPGASRTEICETDMPIVEIQSRRLIYLLKNNIDLTPKRILMLPFLHTRNVLMRKQHPDREYHTTILRKYSDDSAGLLSDHYVTMSISSLYVQVYSVNGLQTNKFSYEKIASVYGKPKATSNNGQFIIFGKKKTLKLHIMLLTSTGLFLIKTLDVESDLKDYLENDVIQDQGITQAQHLQENIVNGKLSKFTDHNKYAYTMMINDNLDICIKFDPKKQEQNEDTRSQQWQAAFEDKIRASLGSFFYIQKGSKNLDMEQLKKCSSWVSVQEAIESIEDQQVAARYTEQYCFMVTKTEELSSGVKGFSFNTKNLFLWNVHTAWKFQIRPDSEQSSTFAESIQKLTLFVDPEEQQTKIRQIITGPTEDIVIIVIKQSKTEWMSLVWNMLYDNEIDQFDHLEPPDVFWGTDKAALIQEGTNKIYFPGMGCVIKSFNLELPQVKQLKKDDKQKLLRKSFSNHFGLKFDGDTHSLILTHGVINLSYSYMTFMMQSVDDIAEEDFVFDVEEYNYLINKKTALHDGQLIQDYPTLQYIVQELEAIDVEFLEQLQYFYIDQRDQAEVQSARQPAVIPNNQVITQYVTPLHIAVKLQETRAINLFLKYQAMLDYSSFNTFKDILPQLIQYKNFMDYLIEQPFSTIQLANKQSIKADDMVTESIVAISQHNSSYVDDAYYKNIMNQDKMEDANTYPVQMKLVEVGWMLNESQGAQYGLKFLQAVFNSGNSDLFDTDTIKITVEYLYIQYKQKIIKLLLPIYILTVLFFLLTLFVFEFAEDERDWAKQNLGKRDANNTVIVTKEDKRLEANYGYNQMLPLSIFNLILNLINTSIVVFKTYQSAASYWNNYWAPIDTLFVLINFFIIGMVMNYEPTQALRIFEAFGMILLAQKSLYFLEMHSKIAPLIIIFYQVLYDILDFMFVILIMFCAFSSAFYLLGQNQLQFDEISATEGDGEEVPLYITPKKALLFMFYMLLGEVGPSGNFDKGKKTQEVALWFLFCVATFFFIIVMMNMLVAIMGDTFVKNYEIEEQNILRTKLRFVIDNWSLFSPFTAQEKKQIQYLVAANLNDNDEEETEAIRELKALVINMKKKTKTDMRKIMIELKKIKSIQTN